MFGSHLSIAGSLVNALNEAESLKMDTVQVFTKNQQQWRVPPLPDETVRAWRDRLAELGWEGRTVSHASYLINLASPDDELWAKSIDLMVEEVRRCHTLGIPFLVHHPGAFTTSTREEGLPRIAAAYKTLFRRTPECRVVSCLENTVGSGSNLGREFTELAHLRDLILDLTDTPERVGVCFDTCHAHAGGYDLSTPASAAAAMEQFDRDCGLKWIRVLHLNDSKAPMGSRRDRHEHIGEGTIGLEGFGVVVSRPEFATVPKIMETPKGVTDKDENLDALNLARLRKLAGTKPPAPASPKPGPRAKAKVVTPATPKPKAKPSTKPKSKAGSKPRPRAKSRRLA